MLNTTLQLAEHKINNYHLTFWRKCDNCEYTFFFRFVNLKIIQKEYSSVLKTEIRHSYPNTLNFCLIQIHLILLYNCPPKVSNNNISNHDNNSISNPTTPGQQPLQPPQQKSIANSHNSISISISKPPQQHFKPKQKHLRLFKSPTTTTKASPNSYNKGGPQN